MSDAKLGIKFCGALQVLLSEGEVVAFEEGCTEVSVGEGKAGIALRGFVEGTGGGLQLSLLAQG